MSDVVSIELLLDAATEARVRADWTRLADAGLSSRGLNLSASNRPHITLLVRTSLPSIGFEEACGLLPIDVHLGRPALFAHGDRGVLMRPAILDGPLRAVRDAVHDAAPEGTDAAHTAPGEWTPHVTLARRLRVTDLDRARALLGDGFSGRGVALRRWDAATARVTTLRGGD